MPTIITVGEMRCDVCDGLHAFACSNIDRAKSVLLSISFGWKYLHSVFPRWVMSRQEVCSRIVLISVIFSTVKYQLNHRGYQEYGFCDQFRLSGEIWLMRSRKLRKPPV